MIIIDVPPVDHPMSSLDGLSLIGIDTDPDEQLYATVGGLHHGGLVVVGVIPWKFHNTRQGDLVIAYDKSKDPRATEKP